MTIYIALLRGINVGGKNKIKMADLKRTFEAVGVSRVQTYIQSGNVLFESDADTHILRQQLEDAIYADYGIQSTVILRTVAELETLIETCPYAAFPLGDGESIQVTLLTEAPSQEKVDMMERCESGDDEFSIHDCEIYFLLRQSILDSKLAKSLQKIGNAATTRNWNTINKLCELAREMRASR